MLNFQLIIFFKAKSTVKAIFDPLTPYSDQDQISPHNIAPESNIKVMRTKEMITN